MELEDIALRLVAAGIGDTYLPSSSDLEAHMRAIADELGERP